MCIYIYRDTGLLLKAERQSLTGQFANPLTNASRFPYGSGRGPKNESRRQSSKAQVSVSKPPGAKPSNPEALL